MSLRKFRYMSAASALLACIAGLSFVSVFAVSPDVNWSSLNLTTDQSEHINQVDAQWRTTASQLMPQLQDDKSELVKLLNSPNTDQQKIMDLQNRINTNKSQLQNAAMQSYLKKKDYLNPEQQQQLQQLMGPNLH